ncbi:NAD(P)H nitroreductase [Actinoallomurus acanthiterrae]
MLIEAASWAPSVHNTQPWSFGVHRSRLSVQADPDRRLKVADPDGREMLISCGAALFNLRLAARHLGRVPEIRLLPDPGRPGLLADVDFSGQRPATPAEDLMFAQVKTRRTHRRGFAPDDLPTALVPKLHTQARQEGTALRLVADPRAKLALAALSEAGEQIQRLNPAYVAEVARWAPAPGSHRDDGVHSGAYPREPAHTDPSFPVRDFARGMGWGHAEEKPDHLTAAVTGKVLLLMTSGDTPADWLAAGMALQRILLCAAEDDVSAAFHTQALEIGELRALIRSRFCDGAFPQMLLRIGHAGGHHGSVRRPGSDITRQEP